MTNIPILNGPGYSVRLPDGFNLVDGNPVLGIYRLLPPGAHTIDTPALIQIRSVFPAEFPVLLQQLYYLDNPQVAIVNATNLGLVNIMGILPVREVTIAEGKAHIREFDAITIYGIPVRVMILIIQGIRGIVEVLMMVHLYRWVEFVGPCLEFVGGINLSGGIPSTGQVRAVIDKKHLDQIEYQLVNPDNTGTPFTAFPTRYGNVTIIENITIDNSIKTGDLNGTGIVVGNHSIAKVS